MPQSHEQPLTTVGVVGLGTIAKTHITVLRDLRPDVEVIGIDPHGSAARAAPLTDRVYADVDAAADATPRVGLWVVATPTNLHLDAAVRLLAEAPGTRIVVEKPLVPSLDDLDRLLREVPMSTLRSRLFVSHHFAFSPEVVWAVGAARRIASGSLVRATLIFHDPYAGKAPSDRRSYVDPWVDSGPNQLSVLLVTSDEGVHVTTYPCSPTDSVRTRPGPSDPAAASRPSRLGWRRTAARRPHSSSRTAHRCGSTTPR
jgi:predicted dehydrogenase